MSKLRRKLIKDFKDIEYGKGFVEGFLNAKIATQIKVLRKQRGWTQEKLAKIVDMEQARISILENVNYDKWSISTLKRLADAFQVTLNVDFTGIANKLYQIEHFSQETLEIKPWLDDLAEAEKNEISDSATQRNLYVVKDIRISGISGSESYTPTIPARSNSNVEELQIASGWGN